jgi:hypothetical protein
MKLVSCGADGTLWAINSERFTFRLDREALKWDLMPGSFKQVPTPSPAPHPTPTPIHAQGRGGGQVSVGSKKHVWGVDSKDCIYKWKKGTWQRVTVSEVPQHISVASDGSIVAMDKDMNGVMSMKKLGYALPEGKEGDVQ